MNMQQRYTTKPPKEANMDNPVQAVGAARGGRTAHTPSELLRSSTVKMLNCYAVPVVVDITPYPELRYAYSGLLLVSRLRRVFKTHSQKQLKYNNL